MNGLEAAAWLALAVSAYASQDGTAHIAAKAGRVELDTECWRVKSPRHPRHQDPMSHRGSGGGCAPLKPSQECVDWRVSVVKDHDGGLIVGVEVDVEPRGDAGQQALALAVNDPVERAEILALWPQGAWNQLRLCAGEERISLRVAAPRRCLVLHPDGKPAPVTVDRGDDTLCAVAHGGADGAVVDGAGYGAAGHGLELEASPPFPVFVEPNGVTRFTYRIAGNSAMLRHTPVLLQSARQGSMQHEWMMERHQRP